LLQVFGAVESMMVAKGVPILTVRKLATTVASTLQSTFAVLFGLTKSPVMAAVYYNLVVGVYGIHHAGFSSNLIEVGGEDTAIMNAIGAFHIIQQTPLAFLSLVSLMYEARSFAKTGSGQRQEAKTAQNGGACVFAANNLANVPGFLSPIIGAIKTVFFRTTV